MSTKFIHIRPGRYYDAETKSLVGEPDSHGGMTVAYDVVTTHADHTASGHDEVVGVRYAIAECHHRDHYNAKKGRLLSEGRLHLTDAPTKEHPKGRAILHVHTIPYVPGTTVTEQILRDIGIEG